ncbi:MAG: serine/threonine-protein kinase [Acidimicrobiales bacterium]
MSDADPASTRPPRDLSIPGLTEAVEIGAGGFGVVYRAAEADLSRTVAVKILAANLDEAGRDRFDRERRAMGTLSGHPNIVTVYRGGYTPAGQPYLVMEYLDRGSLADHLRSAGTVSWTDTLTVGVQLAGALETAHRAGVLHRDIKPGNILLSRLGSAKLCDFGIARLQGAFETRSSTVTASLAHAPPEVVDGRRPDARSDVYSLASTLYELVTGRPPFVQPTDESMVQILNRIHTAAVPPVDESVLPEPLFRAIETAMAKDPAARPASALDFGQLLVHVQHQIGLAPTPIPIEDTTAASAAGLLGGPVTSPPFPVTGGASPTPAVTGAPGTPGSAPTVTGGSGPGGPAATGGAPPGYATGPGVTDAGQLPGGTSGGVPVAGGVGTTTGPHPAGPGRPPRWLAPAAAVAALVLVGAVLMWQASGGTDDADGTDDTTEVSTASPATGPGATASSAGATTEPPPTPGNSVGLPGTGSTLPAGEKYASYRELADTTDSIRIKVPDEWTADTLRGPGSNKLPYLAAAPQLEGAFFDSLTGAGVSVEVFDRARVPNEMLDEARARSETLVNQCDVPESSRFIVPYPGRFEVFRNCGPTATALVHVAVVNGDDKVSALLTLQAPTGKDLDALSTIVGSLVLTPKYR